jgi:hypothetical protein
MVAHPQSLESDVLCDQLGYCLDHGLRIVYAMSHAVEADKPILIAIAILMKTLAAMLTNTYTPEAHTYREWQVETTKFRTVLDPSQVMHNNGWCPRIEDNLMAEDNVFEGRLAFIYYVGKLKQPPGVAVHSMCSVTRCKVGSDSTASRVYKHRRFTEYCGVYHVDLTITHRLLEIDEITLLKMSVNMVSKAVTIEVVSSRDYPKYVALSHMWKDGLWNPAANALPVCPTCLCRLHCAQNAGSNWSAG